MSITSLTFLIFVLAVFCAYFIVPARFRWMVVLAANIVFYCWSGVPYFFYVAGASLAGWIAAVCIERITVNGSRQASEIKDREAQKTFRQKVTSHKRIVCAIAVILVLGIWIVLKYGNFIISNLNSLLRLFHVDKSIGLTSWVMPIGMSFYTFHIIGYVVDIYRKKYSAERNYLRFLTFVSYFPHVIQGPFSRFDELGKSILQEHRFSYDRLCQGLSRILWGLVKKLIVADKLGVTVDQIISHYSQYTGTQIVFAFMAYAIQLYADFSGYMDIVCGISHILGIELSENFRQPYFAKTVDEYWRRWHITLGKWFKDYVFMPVSMGRTAQKLGRKARKKWGPKMGKLVPGYLALLFVWTATGLWHGASWKYLAWGYLNLLVILSTMQLGDFYSRVKQKLHIRSDSWYWKLFCICRTFFLVSFFRFFSISASFMTALSMIRYMAGNVGLHILTTPDQLFVKTSLKDIILIIAGFLMMLFVDILQETGKWETVKTGCPFWIRDVIYVFFIMLLILFAGGSTDLVGGFMYANF